VTSPIASYNMNTLRMRGTRTKATKVVHPKLNILRLPIRQFHGASHDGHAVFIVIIVVLMPYAIIGRIVLVMLERTNMSSYIAWPLTIKRRQICGSPIRWFQIVFPIRNMLHARVQSYAQL
jgi:hypothetical protein